MILRSGFTDSVETKIKFPIRYLVDATFERLNYGNAILKILKLTIIRIFKSAENCIFA